MQVSTLILLAIHALGALTALVEDSYEASSAVQKRNSYAVCQVVYSGNLQFCHQKVLVSL
jgi:hypothetical protein